MERIKLIIIGVCIIIVAIVGLLDNGGNPYPLIESQLAIISFLLWKILWKKENQKG